MKPTLGKVLGLVALAGGIFNLNICRAELMIAGFGGLTHSERSDLELRSGSDQLNFHDLSFDKRDLNDPPYYGYRVWYFPSRQSNFGFGLEFIHSKIYMDTADTAFVTGTRGGAPVAADEELNDTFGGFNLSHGLNYVFADAIYRVTLDEEKHPFLARFQPYAGIGLGATIPHVEVRLAGQPRYSDYQFGGFAAQGLAGLGFNVTKHIQIFTEYKFTYARLDDIDIPTGKISLDVFEHHWVWGVALRF
jgi:lipid A oxidase